MITNKGAIKAPTRDDYIDMLNIIRLPTPTAEEELRLEEWYWEYGTWYISAQDEDKKAEWNTYYRSQKGQI